MLQDAWARELLTPLQLDRCGWTTELRINSDIKVLVTAKALSVHLTFVVSGQPDMARLNSAAQKRSR